MKIKRVRSVFFSPTGTSKKIVEAISAGMPCTDQKSLDLTYPGKSQTIQCTEHDLVIIGVPVYAGRVAPLAARRLEDVRGSNTPAILVVLYGNREYEDALVELRDIAAAHSFVPVGASAFIGEHSFSDRTMPTALGRPDQADLAVAASFGETLYRNIVQLQNISTLSPLVVPGNIPYKEGMGPLPVSPALDPDKCTLCTLCAATCPGGAITVDDEFSLDTDSCIFCCACIKGCPEQALSIKAPLLLEKRQWLHENCATRKEPEFYP